MILGRYSLGGVKLKCTHWVQFRWTPPKLSLNWRLEISQYNEYCVNSILWPPCPPHALNFFAFTWHSCAIETLMVTSVAWLPPLWIFGWSTDRIGQFHWRFECHEGFWVWAWTSVLPLAFKSSNFCSLEWCNLYFSMKKTKIFSFPD